MYVMCLWVPDITWCNWVLCWDAF